MNKLSVKGNYLFKNDKPFFWLGDTAWLMLNKIEFNDVIIYLKNRKSLGFNVIQTILIPDENTKYNDIKYWNYVRSVIDYAKSLDLYIALLPAWGRVYKKGIINICNVEKYAKFLVKFFQQDNIIWVLGGDIKGDECLEIFNKFGTYLKELDNNRLITFHPFGRTGSYLWFNDEAWLDFNMFQSGHRRYDQLDIIGMESDIEEATFGESSYKYVIKNFMYNNKKPCLDAEPSYEGVVQGLHDYSQPYWEANHIRRYAYFSVLEGACGFTYGNNSIIQFYTEGPGQYGVRESWKEGLHSVGGTQLQYLKQMMESIDYVNGKAHPEYVLNNKNRCNRISCFAGNSFIICYTYFGEEIRLNLSEYNGKDIDCYWINPENNSKSYFNTIKGGSHISFKPIKRKELANDWLLYLLIK